MIYTLLILLLCSHPFICLKAFDQSECGRTKSCIRWSSCQLPICDLGFSWRMIDYNSTKYLEIEIVGHMTNNTNGYIALGFSLDTYMHDNGMVTCHMFDSQLNISCGHNGVHSNILYQDSDIDSDFLVKFKDDLYGVEFDSASQQLRCRFLRLMSPTKMTNELKDLSNGSKYYLLSSKGLLKSENKLSYHYVNKRASSVEYDLASSNRVNSIIGDIFTLIKVHASLMIIGWILFATNGIIIAYFFKNKWMENSLLGQKVWFQLHRLLQTCCILCVITGFIVIFVHVGGYSTMRGLPNSAHPVLGITATSLLLINPIIALFRCQPDVKSRWIFNWVHFIVGVSAYVLALSTMAIGIQLPSAGKYLSSMLAPWLLVVILLVLVVVCFLFQSIWKYRTDNAIVSHGSITLGPGSKINVHRFPIEWISTTIIFTIVLITMVIIY